MSLRLSVACALGALALAAAGSAQAVTMTFSGTLIYTDNQGVNGAELAADTGVSIPSPFTLVMTVNDVSTPSGRWTITGFDITAGTLHYSASDADAGWQDGEVEQSGSQFGFTGSSHGDYVPTFAGDERLGVDGFFHFGQGYIKPPSDPAAYLGADNYIEFNLAALAGQASAVWTNDVPGGPLSGSLSSVSIDGTFIRDVVPEPGAWSMMILGFGAAGAMLRRRYTQVDGSVTPIDSRAEASASLC